MYCGETLRKSKSLEPGISNSYRCYLRRAESAGRESGTSLWTQGV
jgi:hypothetical protein